MRPQQNIKVKTIFARIQGLQLGESLDDGTDLNKYSKALATVGINIKDANGDLKDMDTILNEMGARWQTLSRDQQAALAQTVAGTRQYTQLVSMMDNWDVFLKNVNIAKNAEGTLDKQQEVFMESWEAAANQVQAAAENIYNTLFTSDDVIPFLNTLESVLTVVGEIVEAFHGLAGIVPVALGFLLKSNPQFLGKAFGTVFAPKKSIQQAKEDADFEALQERRVANYYDDRLNNEQRAMSYIDYHSARMKYYRPDDLTPEELEMRVNEEQNKTSIAKALVENAARGLDKAIEKETAEITSARKGLKDAEFLSPNIKGANKTTKDLVEAFNVGMREAAAGALAGDQFSKMKISSNQYYAEGNESWADVKVRGLQNEKVRRAFSDIEAQIAQYDRQLGRTEREQWIQKKLKTSKSETNKKTIQALMGDADAYEAFLSGQVSAEAALKAKGELKSFKFGGVNTGVSDTTLDEKGVQRVQAQRAVLQKVRQSILNQYASFLGEGGETNLELFTSALGDAGVPDIEFMVDAIFDRAEKQGALEKSYADADEVMGAKMPQKPPTPAKKPEEEEKKAPPKAPDKPDESDEQKKQTEEASANMAQVGQSAGTAAEGLGQVGEAAGQAAEALGEQVEEMKEEKAKKDKADQEQPEQQQPQPKQEPPAPEPQEQPQQESGEGQSKSKPESEGKKDDGSRGHKASFGEGFSQAAGGLAEMAGGAMATYAAIKAIGDESLSTGEKVLTACTSGTAGLFSLVDGAQTAAEGFSKMNQYIETAGGLIPALTKGASALAASPLFWALAAMAAVSAGIIAFDALVETDAEKIEKLTKAQEELQKSSRESTDQANSLKSALEGYESAAEKLNQCTRGTEEWATAMKEVQSAVETIAEIIPDGDLGKVISRDEQGNLVVNKDKVQGYIQNSEERAMIANLGADIASTRIKVENLNTGSTLSSELFLYMPEEIKKLLPDYNSFKILTEDWAQQSETFEELQLQIEKYTQSIATDRIVPDYVSEIMSAFWASRGKKVEEAYFLERQKIAAETEYYNRLRLQVENLYGDTFGFDGVANDYGAAMQTWSRDNRYDYYLNEFKKDFFLDAPGEYALYQNVLGIIQEYNPSYAGVDDKKISGSGASRRFKFFNRQTGEEEEFTAEKLASIAAAQKSLEYAGENAEAFANFLSETDEITRTIAVNIAKTFDGKEFNMKTAWSGATIGNLFFDDYLIDFSRLGSWFGFPEEVIKDVLLGDFTNNISPRVEEFLTRSGLTKEQSSEISLSLVDKILSSMDKSVQGGLGNRGENFVKRFIGALVKGANPKDTAKILEIFTQQDWSQWNAMAIFKQALEDVGFSIDNLNLDDFTDHMRQLGLACPVNEFQALADAIKDITGITNRLGLGNILSEEDYEQLVKMFPELKDKFVQGYNGYTQVENIDYDQLSPSDATIALMNKHQTLYDNVKDAETLDAFSEVRGAGGWGRWSQDKAFNDLHFMFADMLERGAVNSELMKELGFIDYEQEGMNEEQYRNFFKSYENFLTNGAAGNFDSSLMSQLLISSAPSMVQMQETAGFTQGSFKLTFPRDNGLVEVSQEGIQAMQAYAAQMGPEGQQALREYREEMAKTTEGTYEAKKAANDFRKSLWQIEADKAALEIKKLKKSYEEATKELEKTESLEGIAEELEKVFGGDIDLRDLEKNIDVVDKWLNGTEEESQIAARGIYRLTHGYGTLESAIQEANAAGVEDAKGLASHIQEALGSTESSALLMAQRLINAYGSVEAAAAAVDGSSVHISADADVGAALGALLGVRSDAEITAEMISQLANMGAVFVAEVDGTILDSGDPQAIIDSWGSVSVRLTGQSTDIPSWLPSGGAGKSSGGGGGGGGGGGKKKTLDKKEFVKEQDRYHVIKNQIEDLTSFYDDLSSARDRAFGSANLDLLEKEMDMQAQLIAAQKVYLSEIEGYLETDRNKMIEYGATFDVNGTITNYDDILRQQVDKYNAAVETFNNSGQGDADQETFDDATEDYEEFLEFLEQYEETQDLLKEETQQLLDLQYEYFDKLLESTQMKVDLRIDVSDRELKNIEFLLATIEDDAMAAAEKIALIGAKADESTFKIATYRNALNELFSRHGVAGALEMTTEELIDAAGNLLASKENIEGFTQDEIDAMGEFIEGLIDESKSLHEARKEVFEALNEQFEAGVDELDLMIEKQEHLGTLAESFANIVDIVGKRQLGMTTQMLNAIKQTQIELSKSRIAAARDKQVAIQEELAAAKAARQAAIDANREADIALWDEQIKTIEEAMREASEEVLSTLEESLELVREAFDTAFENIADDFRRAIAGAAGHTDVLQDQFDRAAELGEKYVESYDKIYELSKLIREAGKSIDETDNLRAQKELLALQQEFIDLRNSDKDLSEYDLKYLRLRYEAKVAEMALDEAKNAKTQVRMSRDENGNFSYVYTADEDAVADAEQKYEDKLYEMQVANGEYIQQLSEEMMNLENTYMDSLEQIKDTLTIGSEEYYNALDELNTWYMTMVEINNAQMAEVIANNNILYEMDIANYNRAMQAKQLEDEDYIANFNEIPYALLTGYQTMEEMTQAHNEVHQELLNMLSEAENAFLANNQEVMTEAGLNYKQFGEQAGDALKSISEESADLKDEMEDLANTIKEDFVNKGLVAIKTFSEQYSSYIDIMVDKTAELVSKFDRLVEVWADINREREIQNNWEEMQRKKQEEYEAEQARQRAAAAAAASSGGGGSNSGSGGSGSGGSSYGNITYANGNKVMYDDSVSQDTLNFWAKQWGALTPDSSASSALKQKATTANKSIGATTTQDPKKKTSSQTIATASTGMYTGDWNSSEGKLAVLHEKELVLNKADTSNILNAVDMVRQLSKLIDLNALGMTPNGLLSSVGLGAGLNKQPLEQQVSITAEFPNATDRNEIAAAFEDIVNLAAQYAGR